MSNYNSTYTTYLMNRYGVAWYKFNETVATSVVDSKGTSVATVNGTTVIPGIENKARSFNGTSDFIKFNHAVIPVGAKSIRFKIRVPTNLPNRDTYLMINLSSYASQHGMGVQVHPSTGKLSFANAAGTQGFRFWIQSPTSVCDNQWHDILFTWDGTTKTNAVKLYVDDMSIPAVTATSQLSDATAYAEVLQIGRLSNTSYYARFDIDELEIYNAVIDPLIKKYFILSGDKYYSLLDKFTDNVIPTMTSSTSPSGVAEASSTYSTFYPWKALDQIVDHNGWATASGVLTGWLSYEFSTYKVIEGYSIKSGTTPAKRLPKNWTFEGWDGAKWAPLDSRSNQANFAEEEFRFFEIKNKIAYKKYRINVTANQGATDFLTIGDFGMYESKKILLDVDKNERHFLNYGLSKGDLIEFDESIYEIRFMNKTSSSFGTGKVFKQTIDTSKILIKKATIT
ncbi:LamG domain-containing protein [Paenibacillus polysaccharolyticus]|uniref:LamG domain-containing protein n=1 Tax=Paenibacillus polysaccharolyticus TaxID=582692 RepID=UPI00203FBCCD|nr:LamG domain-containing protein [Paenibacillus polysaccharolyticus]MCM3131541.1 LamG domain-containing protein [Paenibacillus polysaccharolyticus]